MRYALPSIRTGLLPCLTVLSLLLGPARPVAGAQTNDVLGDTRGGHWLAQAKGLGVWWCESGWKVGLERALPDKPPGKAEPVSVCAAQGEFEPVQIVLRPESDGELLAAEVGPLRQRWRKAGPVTVRIDEVAYVEVKRPTDKTGQPGWYPDPLPPLRLPLALRAGKNQPLWITFHVPREAKPGFSVNELLSSISFNNSFSCEFMKGDILIVDQVINLIPSHS